LGKKHGALHSVGAGHDGSLWMYECSCIDRLRVELKGCLRSIAKDKALLKGTTRRVLQYQPASSEWLEQTLQPDGKPQLQAASAKHVLVLDKSGLASSLQVSAGDGACVCTSLIPPACWRRL
jgi:hypothetical protein